MKSTRRKELLSILRSREKPITGSSLADEFAVSRQVIVQDIALLRAEGYEILATSRGYVIPGVSRSQTVEATIACRHDEEGVREELMTVVSFGGRILDVIVEHPVYGEMRGMLMIQSPEDVEQFLDNFRQGGANLLCALTDGVHLHTVEAMNEEVIERIRKELKRKDLLLEK
ncbi:MAG: transcription repressor NadR [Bacillota bacterium]